jgi:hypothetical protein
LEDDVIYHEYSHLVTHDLGFIIDRTSSVERTALNEGYAHYFAASYTNDPRIGEWVVTCPPREHCIGPPNDTEMATLATDPGLWNWNDGDPSDHLKYGACTRFHPRDGKCKIGYHNFTDTYTWGMIWGGALWDIREVLGQEVADRLTLHGLRALDLDAGFAEAAEGLMQADHALFGGVHAAEISTVVNSRGLVPFSDELAAETEEAIELPSLGLFGENPFSHHARFVVDLPAPAYMRLEVFDAIGRRVRVLEEARVSAGRREYVWTPSSLSSGKYFCVLTAGRTRKTVPVSFVP